jgi:hypothetical protein
MALTIDPGTPMRERIALRLSGQWGDVLKEVDFLLAELRVDGFTVIALDDLKQLVYLAFWGFEEESRMDGDIIERMDALIAGDK